MFSDLLHIFKFIAEMLAEVSWKPGEKSSATGVTGGVLDELYQHFHAKKQGCDSQALVVLFFGRSNPVMKNPILYCDTRLMRYFIHGWMFSKSKAPAHRKTKTKTKAMTAQHSLIEIRLNEAT